MFAQVRVRFCLIFLFWLRILVERAGAGVEVKFSYSFSTPEELEELSQSDEVAGGGDYQFLHDSPLSLRRFDQQDPTNPTSIEPSRWCLKVRNVDILCKYVKPRLSGTEGLDVMDGIPPNKVRCGLISRRCACTTTIKHMVRL